MFTRYFRILNLSTEYRHRFNNQRGSHTGECPCPILSLIQHKSCGKMSNESWVKTCFFLGLKDVSFKGLQIGDYGPSYPSTGCPSVKIIPNDVTEYKWRFRSHTFRSTVFTWLLGRPLHQLFVFFFPLQKHPQRHESLRLRRDSITCQVAYFKLVLKGEIAFYWLPPKDWKVII